MLGRMKKLFVLPVIFSIALTALTVWSENTALQPAPRDAKWVERHEGFVAEAKKDGIEVLFLGDSITDGWRSRGKAVWEKEYALNRTGSAGIRAGVSR